MFFFIKNKNYYDFLFKLIGNVTSKIFSSISFMNFLLAKLQDLLLVDNTPSFQNFFSSKHSKEALFFISSQKFSLQNFRRSTWGCWINSWFHVQIIKNLFSQIIKWHLSTSLVRSLKALNDHAKLFLLHGL